jgi:hypothetical protein
MPESEIQVNSKDNLNDTAQQITAMLKELGGHLSHEDRDAVGALTTRLCRANTMEGDNAEISPRLPYAALAYALTVLRGYMGAQAWPRGNGLPGTPYLK